MLDAFQSALYQRLQDFELDDPTHEFGFTRHLIKNQGWTEAYARRAIAEYKKFAFLTVVADHQVVPSDQVDQVWHAHVLLTQSYWEKFCPKVLGKPLHHHPARGGRAERAEFHRLYTQTIASYRQFFGAPPTDIWSPSDVRFGSELKMQRVCLSEYWVIPKRLPTLGLANVLSAIAVLTFASAGWVSAAQGATIGESLYHLTASQYNAIVIASVILGFVLRYLIRTPGKQLQKPQLDVYQMAYLVGGAQRAVALAISQLVQQGYLRPNVRHRTLAIAKTISPGANPLEYQVMQRVHHIPDLKRLRQTARYKTDFLKADLERENLLMSGWAAWIGGSFGPFLPVSVAMLFISLVIGEAVNPRIVVVIATLWQCLGIVSVCCFVPSNRTRWGNWILADIKKNHDAYDVMQRFALHGYQALSGGVLDDLKQIFQAEAAAAAAATGGCGCGC